MDYDSMDSQTHLKFLDYMTVYHLNEFVQEMRKHASADNAVTILKEKYWSKFLEFQEMQKLMKEAASI